MMDIEEMYKRHSGEVRELREKCPHKKVSKWLNYAWAPGHFWGKVKVCKTCGKILKRRVPQTPKSKTVSSEGEWKIVDACPIPTIEERKIKRPQKKEGKWE